MAFYLRQRSKGRDENRAQSPKPNQRPSIKTGDIAIVPGRSPNSSPKGHAKHPLSPTARPREPASPELISKLSCAFATKNLAELTALLTTNPTVVTANATCFSSLLSSSRLIVDSKVKFQACSLLHVAVASDWPAAVQLLLSKGAGIDAQTSYNQFAPLHVAVADASTPVLLQLLEAGASPFCTALYRQGGQSTWYRPQGLAEALGNQDAARVLQEAVLKVGEAQEEEVGEVPDFVDELELEALCELPDEAANVRETLSEGGDASPRYLRRGFSLDIFKRR